MKLQYKKAMEKISLSANAMEKIQGKIQEKTPHPKAVPMKPVSGRRWAPAAAAICLAVVLLSTGAAGAYGYFFHEIPDGVGNTLKPIKLTHTSQDITMTVQYASVENGTLAAYLTLEDISGNDRLARGVDFYHSYSVSKPEGTEETSYVYRSLGYDGESGTYGFLVQITPSGHNGKKLYFENQQYTLSIGQLLLAQNEYKPSLQPDWNTLPVEPDTRIQSCNVWGYVNNYPKPVEIGKGKAEVLQPGSWEFPVADGFEVTAAGFLGNGLHIQLHYMGKSEHDHENLMLALSDGTLIGHALDAQREFCCSVGFYGENGDRYTEYIFDITPEELEGASLCGDYLSGGYLLDGDWEVTFSVEM